MYRDNKTGSARLGQASLPGLSAVAFVFYAALATLLTSDVGEKIFVGSIAGSLVAVFALPVLLDGLLWSLCLNGICGVIIAFGQESWTNFVLVPLIILGLQVPTWILRFRGWRLYQQTTSSSPVNRFSIADVLALTALAALVVRSAAISEYVEYIIFPISLGIGSSFLAVMSIRVMRIDSSFKKVFYYCAIYYLAFGAAIIESSDLIAWPDAYETLGYLLGMYSMMSVVLYFFCKSGCRLLRRGYTVEDSGCVSVGKNPTVHSRLNDGRLNDGFDVEISASGKA